MPAHRRPGSLLSVSLAAAAIALGALAAGNAPPPRDARPQAGHDAPVAVLHPLPPPAAGWREVDRLQAEQKMQAALDAATKLRAAAQQRKDDAEWARGLVREAQLRIALHGYGTAVRELRAQPWPTAPLPHALLELFYGEALSTYRPAYAY